jgi:hypothetical protein
VVALLAAVLLLGCVVGILVPAYQEHQRRDLEDAAVKEAEATRVAEKSEEPGKGMLKIWVPAGAVGDDYWVYLDGHIVSAPPRRKRELIVDMMGSAVGPGEVRWLDFGNEHLAIRDGDFVDGEHFNKAIIISSYISRNIDLQSGDAKHLFYPVDLPLQSGKYNVEVAYLLKGLGSFPFAVTRKYIADLRISERTQLFIGVPDAWSEFDPAVAQPLVCAFLPSPGGNSNADVLGLMTNTMTRYLNDPMVQALRALNASVLSRPKGIVVLDLPAAQGGAREFDGSQVRYIANAILQEYEKRGPRHEDVARCRQSNPEFSQSYDEYDRLISDLESQLQFFHTLAGK